MCDKKEVLRYENCFICGDKNSSGVQARFYFDGEQATTEIVADEMFEGYKGIYHGGVISSLLDEVMIKAILATEIFAVTAEMTVKYVKPVKVGEKLIFTGKVTKAKGRLFFTEGVAQSETGEIFATATGKYVEAGNELKEILMQSASDK